MKKIGLYLGSEPYSGGAFQYGQTMLEAVAALPKKDYTVSVGYSSPLWGKILAGYDVAASYRIPLRSYEEAIALWWRRLGFPTTVWRKIIVPLHPFSQRIMRENCNLWIFPAQDIWAYRVPVPALTTVFDLMHRYEKRFSEVSARGRYRRREAHYRDICRWSKGILVDSNVGKQQLIESYDVQPDRVHVLPSVPPKYIYSNDVPVDFDVRYSLPAKFIFYPAQFWSHKNHSNLIEAVAVLKGRLPDLKLVFVGSEKNGYDTVVKIVRDSGLDDSVLFLGYVPDEDMAEFYRRARALVMPTFFGPTNIPPLEAFVLGCPVAVSNIYGMPEQAGDAALLFDPNRVEEIADAIHRLWSDDSLCRLLADNGRKRAAAWGSKQFSARLEAILDSVLNSTS
jgi:glycosyltransferase involved in cell wall biosynthesis